MRDLTDRGLTLLTVDRDVIAEWIDRDRDDGKPRKARTRALYVTRMGLLFAWLQDEGHRQDLPTKGVPKPKVPRSIPRPIPELDLYRALELADPRVALMITLENYAGLRRAEVAGIDRADIRDADDPPTLLVHGKGAKERLVPIGPDVAAALARYGIPERGPLFPSRRGGPLSPHTVGLLVSGHLRATGFDGTGHQGRHRFITQLYRETLDLRLCQEMAGHADPATTAGYAAFSPDKAAHAIARLPSRPIPEPVPDEAA